ncbi:MAG: hypothetical protein KIG76_08000 [Eubacteriales bacterium]|nr:hypothetical protein [Candidatus Colimorpha enterica]
MALSYAIGTLKSCFAELYPADSFGVGQFGGAENGNDIIADGQDNQLFGNPQSH